MASSNPLTKSAASEQPQPSTKFWDVLRRQLAILSEHYRQPITERSVMAYAQDLSGLTPDRLEAACVHARRSSEFLPVSAAILKADRELEVHAIGGEYLGPRLLEYPSVTEEERAEALKFSAALREKL